MRTICWHCSAIIEQRTPSGPWLDDGGYDNGNGHDHTPQDPNDA